MQKGSDLWYLFNLVNHDLLFGKERFIVAQSSGRGHIRLHLCSVHKVAPRYRRRIEPPLCSMVTSQMQFRRRPIAELAIDRISCGPSRLPVCLPYGIFSMRMGAQKSPAAIFFAQAGTRLKCSRRFGEGYLRQCASRPAQG